MAFTLPEELVEEILLRLAPDEPADLVRASISCKSWRSILSDDTFRRRYCRFHRTPPLLGYFCTNFSDLTVRFVPTTSVAAVSPVCAPMLNDSTDRKPTTLDCRHGRVLIIQPKKKHSRLQDSMLIVSDPITGVQQQLRVPAYLNSRHNDMAAAVLCAEDGCDHLDCHGGSFLVVLVGNSYDNNGAHKWASVYSSKSGAWSARTPNASTYGYLDNTRPSLLVGDALYFPTIYNGHNIIKYDLCNHELSDMGTPTEVPFPILIKENNGGIGLVAILQNCIYKWSWQVDVNGVGEWVKYKVMELDDTLLPKRGRPRNLICNAGANIVFIGVDDTGIFMLDLKSKQVRKIGERNTYFYGQILLPFMSFYTPNISPFE